ncbi:MAG: efflux RND transporter permease subunit [Planctomycetota bacterium]|nr:efflux RND transporter permease subunit [Planctomycetota bacterium]
MVKLAVRYPHGVLVFVLAVLVLGVAVIREMPTDVLPTYKKPAVQILTMYPGMPAVNVEKDITSRIQRWTGQSVGIEHQEAKSMLGISIVKNFFHEHIDPDAAMAQVSAYAISDLYYLPPGTWSPMMMPFDPTATFPLCLLAVSSERDDKGKVRYDETALYDIAYYELRNRMQSIQGVVAPAVYGGKLRRILAYTDPARMESMGRSSMDVVESIDRNNVFIPVGAARIGGTDYLLDSNALPPDVEEFNDFPLFESEGRMVRIRDVADVQDSSEIQSNIVRIDGARQAYIPIYRQPGSNTIAIVEGVKAKLEPIKARLPGGVNLDVIFDQSVFVRKAIDNLLLEMAIGGLLAALMILVFLRSLRTMLFILIQLPLTVVASFIGLSVLGQTINMMTLGGLALVTGMILDEGIVAIENIARHLELGKKPMDAAIDGMQEMARPRLLIMFTVTVVFFPVIFLAGIGKYLFVPMAISVGLAMLFSYLFTMTFLPLLASRFLKAHEREGPIGRVLKGMLEGLQNGYGALLRGALKVRWLTVAGAGALVAFCFVALFPLLGQELFPQVDAGQFMIRVRETPGLTPAETEITCIGVERIIQEAIPKDHLVKMITNIGVLNEWPAAYTPNSGSGDAFVSIQLADTKERPSVLAYVAKLRGLLNAEFPGVEFSFDTAGILSAAVNNGVAAPINVQIDGKDLDVAHEIAEEVRNRIASIEGAQDVRIQQQLNTPMYRIEIDREKAFRVGIDAGDIVKNVVTAFRSSISFAKSFWLDPGNGNHYFVGAQYPVSAMDLRQAIEETVINPGEGRRPIQLKTVATIERDIAPNEVTHLNITRVTDVFANVEGRDVGAVAIEVDAILADLRASGRIPKGYAIHNRGEVSIMRESFQGLTFGLALAAVLVYLVMVLLFRSFIDPFIVMFAVPLGSVGVIVMLLATDTTINIQSIMGVIMMVGIVVAFSTLLVEFANQLRARGKSPYDAIVEASVTRLRPILMTSFAAVLGLTPMAIDGGANIPLARAVIGGVLAATVLTLFVVPCLYMLIRGRSAARKEVAA